jgi:hypothetical protein
MDYKQLDKVSGRYKSFTTMDMVNHLAFKINCGHYY